MKTQQIVGLHVILAALTAASAVAATPIHHYSFSDEKVHDSIGSSDGTLLNGAAVTSGVLSLDGVDGYVQFDEALVPFAPEFSLCFFAEELGPQRPITEIISQGFSGGPGFYFGYAQGTIRLTDNILASGFPFPTDGAWHHYAMTSTFDATSLYIDGVLVASFGPISTTSEGTPTRLGRQFDPFDEFFHGFIDELWIYQGVLTDEEIAALAKPQVAPASLDVALYSGLNITGSLGRLYEIQYSTDAANPTWTPLTTITLTSSPYFWLDPEPVKNGPRRFYRAVSQ